MQNAVGDCGMDNTKQCKANREAGKEKAVYALYEEDSANNGKRR